MSEQQSTPFIEVDDLRRVYTKKGAAPTVAVDGVSFMVTKGRDLGIVGESGSGKSTIARVIMGLESCTSGSVRVFGEDLTRPASGRRERLRRAKVVQMVYQDPYSSLDPRKTVRHCLDEVLRLHPPRGADPKARIRELADLVGLSSVQIGRPPTELSGGQRQRVAIARAIAVEPQLIILDEAVASLDISIQAQILNLLADLREELGTSYLLVSHDLAVVRQLTDDVLVLQHGSVVEQGPTLDVLAHPKEAYTARLCSSIPSPAWRRPGVLDAFLSVT